MANAPEFQERQAIDQPPSTAARHVTCPTDHTMVRNLLMGSQKSDFFRRNVASDAAKVFPLRDLSANLDG